MRELSLFSGAGGGLLATKHLLGWRTLGYVEIDPYCQQVLKARIADGFLDAAPIFGDIRDFIGRGYARRYRGMVDVVSGGFPCQPFSVAGKQLGADDPRNMWPATLGVIRAVRPRFAFLENVPGLLANEYWGTILGDLAEAGFDARWCVLGADDVGAPHRRKRLWILAHPASERSQARFADTSPEQEGHSGEPNDSGANVADAEEHGRIEGRPEAAGEQGRHDAPERRSTWWDRDPADVVDAAGEGRDAEGLAVSGETEGGGALGGVGGPGAGPSQPFVGRMAHGVAHRVDRLRALGNGQVPLVAARAWEILTDAR